VSLSGPGARRMAMAGRWFPLLVLTAGSAVLVASCALDDVGVEAPELGEAPEPGPPPPEDAEEAERRIERWVFDRVNDERRERGLPLVEWDEQMAADARQWSGRMSGEIGFEHQDLQGVLDDLDGYGGLGENIFWATGPVPAGEIHVGWMRSEGHRVNVLAEDFDRLGVGVVCLDGGATWATQRFASAGATMEEPAGEVPPQEPIVSDEADGPACPGGEGGLSRG
jgi:hypothetical protein